MPGTVSASFAQKLANQRELVRQDAVRLLEKAQRQGRDTLTEDEEAEFQALKATMQALSDSENSTLAELRELRTGPALAVADLLILHPNTWSAVRRTKDGFDRYLTQPDPTSGEAASIWGVPVLTTISCPDDTGVLLDTTKFGRVLVREPLGVRVGFANDDFTRNIVRYVGEERLTLAVERPQAVMEISALPSTAEAETTSKKRSSSKKDD
jgi:Phage capsid family